MMFLVTGHWLRLNSKLQLQSSRVFVRHLQQHESFVKVRKKVFVKKI